MSVVWVALTTNVDQMPSYMSNAKRFPVPYIHARDKTRLQSNHFLLILLSPSPTSRRAHKCPKTLRNTKETDRQDVSRTVQNHDIPPLHKS